MDLAVIADQLYGVLDDEAACRAELAAIRVVRGMLDAREAVVVTRLEVLADFPEGVIAEELRVGLGAASRLVERARTCAAFPHLAGVLGGGGCSGSHIDAVTNALRGLTDEEKERVRARDRELAEAASSLSRAQFDSTVKRLVAAVADDDGLDRLARQKTAVRVRSGVDPVSGMWWIRGELDPEAGAQLDARLRATVERLFHDRLPDGCPTDPVLKQQYLTALALIALVTGEAPAGQGADLAIVIDWSTFCHGAHEQSRVDVGLGRFGLPVATIRRWACLADVTPIVVAPDGQRILLGRTVRVANRAQRRALRVLYRTCALCDVPFDHCQIHHVAWYTLGGLTDIDNLLPLCNRHHHLAHEGGWQLHLAPDRTLTITRPDGHVSVHGPPRVRAA